WDRLRLESGVDELPQQVEEGRKLGVLPEPKRHSGMRQRGECSAGSGHPDILSREAQSIESAAIRESKTRIQSGDRVLSIPAGLPRRSRKEICCHKLLS